MREHAAHCLVVLRKLRGVGEWVGSFLREGGGGGVRRDVEVERRGIYSLKGQLFEATPRMRLFGAWESSAEMTVLNKEVSQRMP